MSVFVTMVIWPEAAYLNLRARGWNLQTGAGRQGALGLSPSVGAWEVCAAKTRLKLKRHTHNPQIFGNNVAPFSPRLMSPMSFFFGPFPKLLLRPHGKNMPRFFSAFSSLLSSFSDFPDFCFLASCRSDNREMKWTLKCNKLLMQWMEWWCWLGYLFWGRDRWAVRACAVFGRRRAAGNLVRIWKWLTVRLSLQTLQVQRGLEEPGVAVELHKVEDLQTRHKKKKDEKHKMIFRKMSQWL